MAALAGCRGTPIDVAKGRPSEGDSSYVASDYQPKEVSGLEAFSPENLGKTMKKAVGLGPNQKIAQEHFDAGAKLFAAKEYDKATKEFASAASRWPDSTLEEDAMFLQAESCFFANRYSKAVDIYGELVKKYPNTRHLDTTGVREFAVARYWHEVAKTSYRWTLVPNLTDRTQPLFDTAGHAINAANDTRVNDPRGKVADAAVMFIANVYFEQKRYEDADYYYGLLRSDYPKSPYLLKAYQLGLQCNLLKYQGPGYNGKPLEEADKLIDQMLVQFPTELGEERERIVKAKAEVRAQKATRDIKLAQYWDNGKHYGAARIYYAQVLKDYPQTPFAEEAKTRLAALQGQPNEPPSRLAALTRWITPPSKTDSGEESQSKREEQRFADQQPLSPVLQGVKEAAAAGNENPVQR